MELRQYWAIIGRRWWLIALLAVAAFAISALYAPQSMASYKATVRLALRPQLDELSVTYGEYYQYVSSEYLNDDIGKLVEGTAFLAQLRQRAQSEQGRVPEGSLEVKKAHRILIVESSSAKSEDALLLAKTAGDMLADPQAPYFDLISAQHPQVTLIDPPVITSSTAPSRVGLDIAVRTLLGLIAGIALAFLLDYLDNSVRSAREIEESLGLVVLGEIPT